MISAAGFCTVRMGIPVSSITQSFLAKGKPDTIKVNRKWRGQPGIIENTMAVDYDVVVKVSPDTAYMAKTTSKYLEMDNDTIRHVYAKRLDVKVLWCFKCSNSEPNQSITVSGVVK